MSIFLGSLFCSIDLSDFMPIPYCFDCCIFEIWNQEMSYSLLFFFSRLFWLFGIFCDAIQNWKLFVVFLRKNVIGILIEIALTLYIALGSTDIFNSTNSSNLLSWNIFPFIYVFFNFLHQCVIVFRVQIFHLVVNLFLIILFFLM